MSKGSAGLIAVMIERLGPYHAARLAAAGAALGPESVLALELAAESREYAWDRVASAGFRRRTLVTDSDYLDLPPRRLRSLVEAALEEEQPDAVALNGWGFAEARAALAWCRRRGRVAVLMSESQEHDARRSLPKELVKRALLREVDAALVGGRTHATYLERLGFPRQQVFLGYDAVDNEHFWKGAEAARSRADEVRAALGLPTRYILASARFIPKKNLIRLIEAYAEYRRQLGSEAADLVLLGDGPERPRIEARRQELGIESAVRMPGFKQYLDLPAYYGLAVGFILPSTSEQWGLVVNEALSAGVPALVSVACGSAELIRDGESGFRFDPQNVREMADVMARLSFAGARRVEMGEAARRAADCVSPQAFARGLQAAVACGKLRRARSGVRWRWNPVLWC